MAKKKSTELTLEEKLEQALVPVEEQPYEVPENWCWTFLEKVSTVVMGQSPSGDSVTDNDKDIPLIGGAADMGELLPAASRYTSKPTKISKSEDVIICIRATLGRPIYADGEYCLGRGVAGICPRICIKEFLRYYFINNERYLYENATGTTFLQVTGKVLNSMPVPLPPLAEQQRIVDRIESLFAKLDEAKDKVQAVLDESENRKTAILHKAFTGKLTAKWRESTGISDTWQKCMFESLGTLERGRSKHRPRNDEILFGGEYPFIQTGDVAAAGMYVISHKQTLSEIGYKQSRLFPKGTLCITIAANIGDAAILSYDCCFPDSVVGFTPNEKCDAKYMYFYLNEIKRELERIAPATAQKNLNLQLLGKVEVGIPCIEEQREVVKILEKFIQNENRLQVYVTDTLENIESVKKTILAKAFRAELGTNSPDEESALELLKSILEQED